MQDVSLAFVASALAIAVAVSGCKSDAATAPAQSARSAPTQPIIAVVNGAQITAADLAVAMAAEAKAKNPHDAPGAAVAAPIREEVLERLINEELAAQRARVRGLDADQAFQEELAARQAQVDSFRRQRLAMLLQRNVREHAEVTDAEARRFFDERKGRIQTVTRVWQILLHDRAAIEQARRELDAGARFEDVAARPFGGQLPAGMKPWDLGELKWNQIPEPWAGVLDGLAVGATSPIIEGPRGRMWIIKVIDRRVDPTVTFDAAHAAITTVLRGKAADAAQAKLERELAAGATIKRTPITTAGP